MKVKHIIKKQLSHILLASMFVVPVIQAEEIEGLLTWSKRVELSTPVDGVVQKVFAQPGTIVAMGDVLVQLDPRSFKADLKFARAKLKSTKGENDEAQRELDRQMDMYDRTMLSEHDLQVAKNNKTTAEAAYLQAQSVLTKAKLNLEYSAIRAPFNSVVISTKAVAGMVVATESHPPVLVTVAEASRMLARIYVSASKLEQLVLNQGVKLDVSGNIFQGKIQSIALEPEQAGTKGYPVDIIFDTGDKLFRAGQKVKADI